MTVKRLDEYSQEDQKELKRFHKSFLLFFIGEIFMIVGTFSLSTNINGVYDEFENVAICNDGHIYGFGVKSLRIYDFKFKS